jgi:hypothetical protein
LLRRGLVAPIGVAQIPRIVVVVSSHPLDRGNVAAGGLDACENRLRSVLDHARRGGASAANDRFNDGAKRRLADEYDAAQERGELAKHSETLRSGPDVPKRNVGKATAADVGLSRKEIHEARRLGGDDPTKLFIIYDHLDGRAGVAVAALPP